MGEGPPALLRRFDREQWPAKDLNASLDLWRAARAEFCRVHGWYTGDYIDMLRENRLERRRAWREQL